MTRYTHRQRQQKHALCLATVLLLAGSILWPRAWARGRQARTANVPTCSRIQGDAVRGAVAPTSVTTLEQVYACLLAHYPAGATIDDRLLLRGAMAVLVDALLHRGWDQATATLPALTDAPATDWRAFRRTYTTVLAQLPRDAQARERLAQATIAGMVASLHDDHTRYAPPAVGKAGGAPAGAVGPGEFGPGLRLSADPALPARTRPPVFILAIDAEGPAARAGLRPGDVVTAIDGLPPVLHGTVDQTVLARLDQPDTVRLSVRPPADGRTLTVTLAPATYPAPQPVAARPLHGDIAYVRLSSFVDNAANFVVAAVDGLGLGSRLRGIVLDLRGNGGGSATEPPRLLGAFAHHAVYAYLVDGHGQRTAERTDATMPLLRVPLVVLIDGGCASACDMTAAAVHDLHLGRLVGERTAGDAAGPEESWFLDDGGVLQIPVAFALGAAGEIVDGIGVPPAEEVPATPAALSAGGDPALECALHDLGAAPYGSG